MMERNANEPIGTYGKVYTYADYLVWKIDERIEILKGRIFRMSPSPSTKHQKVSGLITRILYNYFHINSECQVFVAPFDVRLIDPSKDSTDDDDIITVFQPDLCVICDSEKLDKRGCIGAPDLIIEILSPSNSIKEMKYKYELYEENGVQEYWIVDYLYKTIHIYTLRDGKYVGLKPLISEETLTSTLFPSLTFVVGDIFEN